MADNVTLYMFNGSAPSLTAQLMLEHKRLEHRCKHLLVGPHALNMQPRGFDMMTVPAVKIAGRPIQGSRVISRALDEMQPTPPLFPPIRNAAPRSSRPNAAGRSSRMRRDGSSCAPPVAAARCSTPCTATPTRSCVPCNDCRAASS